MIKTWGSGAARRFGESGKGRFAGMDMAKALARLQLLNAMQSIDEVPALKSIGLHKLKGDRKHQWAMTVNGRWRVVFEFRAGDAYNVDIVDYH
ncbi:MAG TPA: type II toxin-antitoxin system RelE/ParE family toxin [Candidatus Cybelea sp.]|nr:type II toxin-antitoxin system RelE/ParE family toxin [Candidatus Cybelea sp.]